MKKYGLCILAAFLFLTVSLSTVSAEFPGWMQVNEDGFGDPQNRQIPSLAQFNGYLYAGAWNAVMEDGNVMSAASQIWRSPDGASWEMVDEREANGAAALIAFKGYLYAGSWSDDAGGKVWRSRDGLSWEYVEEDGFGGGYGIARLAVFRGALYAGTWGDAAELWRASDGADWQPFAADGLGDPNNSGIIASQQFNGSLYWGVSNWASGAQLWRADGGAAAAVVDDGFGDLNNKVISSLAAFKGQLYAGVFHMGEGIKLYRSANGSDWSEIGAVVSPSTNPASALEPVDGQLYLAAGNDDQGLEVWRSADGISWEQIGFAGFGDPDNTGSFFDNAAAVFNGSLYIASSNFETGGEIWKLCPAGCQ